ncbi:hybrid signal transduction histidine kinase M [Tanacetum coccineum]|uniref:Hybrid signal transduction histidine kinase M n=1 Tax=Tanacetum coccineum TaxID=301880 RepID=A0ABQ5FSS5_9ASTR
MAVKDSPPPAPPPPPPASDKIIPFGVTSITNNVTVKLSLKKHNYKSWSSFFQIHLGSLGIKSHIEAKLSEVVSTSETAKDLWDHIQGLLHDYKDARAISLDNELRSIKIGKMSVNEYYTKIKSMADRLKNLASVVSDKHLVMYAINGLNSRFVTIVEIIRHLEPFPAFETTRNMLLLKESSFNE